MSLSGFILVTKACTVPATPVAVTLSPILTILESVASPSITILLEPPTSPFTVSSPAAYNDGAIIEILRLLITSWYKILVITSESEPVDLFKFILPSSFLNST